MATFMHSQYLQSNNNYFKGVSSWQITFISNLILDSAAILKKNKTWDSQSWSLANIMKLGVLLQMWTGAWPELCTHPIIHLSCQKVWLCAHLTIHLSCQKVFDCDHVAETGIFLQG